MKPNRHGKNWTRAETLAVFNHYWHISYGRLDHRNPKIIGIAALMGRTPDSVSMKMCNLASQNPKLRGRNRVGLQNLSNMDKQVWREYRADPESLIYESEQAAAALEGRTAEARAGIEADIANLPMGEERERIVKVRVNDGFFRRTVFSAYRDRCCITGLAIRGLLNASHIVPWSESVRDRLNPHNGLCLNVLHHKAFDLGLMTVTPAGVIKVSPRLIGAARASERAAFVAECDGDKIEMPEIFRPGREFLKHHNTQVFGRASPSREEF